MPELTTLEKHFRTLYTSYINPNVTVYEDMIVYKVPASQALSTEYDLNNLIKGLSLPLIAIANKTHGIYTDSVVVKSKWNAENKNIVRYKLLKMIVDTLGVMSDEQSRCINYYIEHEFDEHKKYKPILYNLILRLNQIQNPK